MSRLPSTRRGSAVQLLRRFSAEIGIEVDALDFGGTAEDQENNNTEEAHDEDVETIIHNPVSLFYHSMRSNFDGIVYAVPAGFFMIAANRFVDYLTSKGGVWGDRHAALCAVCMSLFELCTMLINGTKEYLIQRVVVGIPVNILCNVLVSCFVFNWRPGGMWTPLVTTLSFAISGCATYPLKSKDKKKKTRQQHLSSGQR